jgi:putative ABC transport system ATP-binding protein
MTFLVGPSGCGKTTLISIIANLLTPSAGTVELFGVNLHQLSDKESTIFRRKNIGFIFQQFNLLPALTAAENVCIPLVVQGIVKKKALKIAEEYLSFIGMAEHTEKLPKELSGGQQQRIAIARALVHEPRLLICDEPTASLDSVSGEQTMQLLQERACQEGRCVIIVTHDSRIFKFSDTITHISDGLIQKITDSSKRNE